MQIVDLAQICLVDCRLIGPKWCRLLIGFKALDGVECRQEPCFQCRFVDQLFPPCVCSFSFFRSRFVDFIKFKCQKPCFCFFKKTILLILQQCREVARIYTGMPVYTGVWKRLPVFRLYFCDLPRIFVIFVTSSVIFKFNQRLTMQRHLPTVLCQVEST